MPDKPAPTPIALSWYRQEPPILCWDFPPVWTWQQLFESQEEANALIDQINAHTPGRVDMLVMTTGSTFPSGNVLRHLNRAMDRRTESLGTMAVVGARGFEQALLNVLLQVYNIWGHKVHLFNTVDEAVAFLDKQRIES